MNQLTPKQQKAIELRVKSSAFYSNAWYHYRQTKEPDAKTMRRFAIAKRQHTRTRQIMQKLIPGSIHNLTPP